MSKSTRPVSQKWLRWSGLLLAIILFSALVISSANAETALFDIETVAFSKFFTPDTIGPGSITTLSFSIVNPDPVTLTNLTFTDTLPVSVMIATPANASATCDSVLVAPDGGSTISFRADRFGEYETCIITVDVTSSAVGLHENISEQLTSDSGEHGNAVASLTVDAGLPGFSKSFSPNPIPPGGTSTLTFLIDNTANPADVGALMFADNLPAGMVIAAFPNASTDCGHPLLSPTITAIPGTNVINFYANAIMPNYPTLTAGSSCIVTVDVTVTDPGEYVNVSGVLTVNSVMAGKATAVLNAPRKFLTKSFTDDPIAQGDSVTLEFTVTNLDRSNPVTDITFSDDLEATLPGLAAVGLPLADPCGAGSQLIGTSTITLIDGDLPAEGSCTFSVTLQVPVAASAGIYTNTTSSVSAWLLGDTAIYDPAVDRLVVSAAPRLVKTFDDPVAAGDTVTLTFTITNTSPITQATSIAFIDELTTIFPFPLSVDMPPAGFCGAGSVMSFIFPGGDIQAISMVGGELGVGESCTFSVTINVPIDMPAGTYYNVTENIFALVNGTPEEGRPAIDDLLIVAAPDLRKAFDDPVIPGDTVTLEFSISHAATAPGDATNIAFSDALTFLPDLVATGLPAADVCGAGSLISGTTNLDFSGGSLTPGETCVFSITLQIPVDAVSGIFENETSNVTADVLGLATTGNPAEDELVVAGLALTKTFIGEPVIPSDTVILEFSIVNASTVHTATSIAFTDSLADVLPGTPDITAIDLPKPDVCGPGSLINGTTFLIFNGGSLDPGTSCTFTATLQVPPGAASGTYGNVTSGFSADIDGSSVALENATDELTVFADWLLFDKSFVDDPVVPGDPVTLEFNITNLHDTQSVTSVAFIDDLDAVLPGLVATGLPVNDVCGAGSQISGTSTLALTDGDLGPGASCTFSVQLLVPDGAALGTHHNTTADATGIIGGFNVRGIPAEDDLLVSALALSKSFDGPTVAGGNPVLTFLIQNPSTSTVANLSFSDDLDAVIPGLTVAALPANGDCGLGSQFEGTSAFGLRDGSLEPEASCTFSVTLQVPITASAGSFVNTTSDLLVSDVKAGNPATATLTVEPPPAFSKSFGPDPILLGDISTLAFTIDNTDSVFDASDLDFTDNLPAGMEVADPANASTTCTGGTITAMAGTDSVTYSGGTVDAGASCVVQVDVVGTAVGAHLNTTGDLICSSGISGPASDTLTVDPVADLAIAKSDSPDPILAGENLTYTLVVTNNGPNEATGIVVSDTLPNQFTPSGNTCGASGDPLVWSVGSLSLDDHDTCTIYGTVGTGFNGLITNTATVASDVFDPQSNNNTVTETTTVYQLPSIGDYVWYDANQDGIQDDGEDGVPNVTVNLRDGANTTQLDTTTTNANGFYDFTDLPLGDYLVEFVLPLDHLFTLQDQGASDAVDSDADPSTGQTISTTLEPDEDDLTWDAGIYIPAAIGGYAWYDANEDGIQSAGEFGLSDVAVNLRDGANTNQLDTTTTDASGFYNFSNMPPGDYLVEFVLPAGFSFTPQDQGVDDNVDSDADPVTGQTISTTLESGEIDYKWDAGMFAPPASIGDHVWYDANQDGIQDDGEDGVPDVTVNLRDGANTIQLDSTTTDANGFYSFTNLIPRNYLLEFVLPPDYVFTLQDQGVDDAVDSDADPATGQTISTTLAPDADDFGWDAGLYIPASIGDYVWYDTNQDGIQDDGEDGVPDVVVNLRDGANTTQLYTTTTDASGFYSFSDLLPGDYLVEFVLPSGYVFSLQDQGVDDAVDSDADPATGQTISTTLELGETDLGWDAGLYEMEVWAVYLPLVVNNHPSGTRALPADVWHYHQPYRPERN